MDKAASLLRACCLSAVCLLGAACGSIIPADFGGVKHEAGPALGEDLPDVGQLADKTPLTVGYEVDPAGFSEGVGATADEYFGDGIAILTPPESGGYAWAMYSLSIPEGQVFTGVNLDVDGADLEDEVWVPALPYYIGVANFTKGRWEWLGPFEDFMAAPRLSTELPRETYVNEAGAAWWVILSYCPPEGEPSATTVMYMDGVYDDPAQ